MFRNCVYSCNAKYDKGLCDHSQLPAVVNAVRIIYEYADTGQILTFVLLWYAIISQTLEKSHNLQNTAERY